MPKIEYLYFPDCPGHERALTLLREVMEQEKIQAPVQIIAVESEQDAQRYHFYGSPTIRIDGIDIAPLPADITQPSLACRAYRRADGRISPLPPRELIILAFHRASRV